MVKHRAVVIPFYQTCSRLCISLQYINSSRFKLRYRDKSPQLTVQHNCLVYNCQYIFYTMMIKYIALFALVVYSAAFVIPEDQYQQYLIVGQLEPEEYELVDVDHHIRNKRSFAPGGTQIGGSTESPYPWSVGGGVDRVGKDTIATINAGHKTDQTKITGTWSKVIRGPNRAKPNWSIGVQRRW